MTVERKVSSKSDKIRAELTYTEDFRDSQRITWYNLESWVARISFRHGHALAISYQHL